MGHTVWIYQVATNSPSSISFREFGNVDDFNSVSNDNICDITQQLAMAIIRAMKFKIPKVDGGIDELFQLNTKIRAVVARVIERVKQAGDLHIKGFHLFDGDAFALLDLPFSLGIYGVTHLKLWWVIEFHV